MNDGYPKQEQLPYQDINPDRKAAQDKQTISFRNECRLIHPQGSECGTCPCDNAKDCYCPIQILEQFISQPEKMLNEKRQKRIIRTRARVNSGWYI